MNPQVFVKVILNFQAAFLSLKKCYFYLPSGNFKCCAFKIITPIFQNSIVAKTKLSVFTNYCAPNSAIVKGYLRKIKTFFSQVDQLKKTC